MSIRVVRAKHDHPSLSELHSLCLPNDRAPHWAGGWWWLAHESGLQVGFAGLQPSVQWGDTMYLVRAGVLASHRGRGLQKRLIRVRERFARHAGARWLITDTHTNPASANSLIACGFQMFEPSQPWAARGALYWRKQLREKHGQTR